MKALAELNEDLYLICARQGDIYETISRQGCDVQAFSDLYLRSDFCRRQFDTSYSRYQCAAPEETLEIFGIDRIRSLPHYKDDNIFRPDTAWWIGFTYRQLWYRTGIASRELADRVPFDTLLTMYPGLHTIDEDMAADRIIDCCGL